MLSSVFKCMSFYKHTEDSHHEMDDKTVKQLKTFFFFSNEQGLNTSTLLSSYVKTALLLLIVEFSFPKKDSCLNFIGIRVDGIGLDSVTFLLLYAPCNSFKLKHYNVFQLFCIAYNFFCTLRNISSCSVEDSLQVLVFRFDLEIFMHISVLKLAIDIIALVYGKCAKCNNAQSNQSISLIVNQVSFRRPCDLGH